MSLGMKIQDNENYHGSNDTPKKQKKTIKQRMRSLPIRGRLFMFFGGALLFFGVSYSIGDYSAFIAYLSSELIVSIVRRLKGEYVER